MKNLFNSKNSTLKNVYIFLKRRAERGATTLEIDRMCGTVAAAACVADLRKKGIGALCAYEGLSDQGKKIYRYRLDI